MYNMKIPFHFSLEVHKCKLHISVGEEMNKNYRVNLKKAPRKCVTTIIM